MSYVESIDLTTEENDSSRRRGTSSVSGPVFNAFEIQDLHRVEWETALYEVDKLDGKNREEERGQIKNLFWDLRSEANTPGFGFIVDADRNHVAIPKSWEYPEKREYNEHRIRGSEPTMCW